MYGMDFLIELIKIADRHNRNLANRGKDFVGVRNHLIKKLMEETGEYVEATILDEGESPRKLRKFGCLDQNNVIDYKLLQEVSTEKLHEEIVDIIYVGLCLLRLEKVSPEELLQRFDKKKNYQ